MCLIEVLDLLDKVMTLAIKDTCHGMGFNY